MSAKQTMAYWEIQKEMEKEMDMKEIAEYEETQRLLEEGQVGYLPEKISNRMLNRMVSEWWKAERRAKGGGASQAGRKSVASRDDACDLKGV